MFTRLTLALSAPSLSVAPAFAHLDPAAHGSLPAGDFHPLLGA
ncbi:hypothetical protein [Aminobacter sp. BE322]